ncbi:ATP-binding protein [Methylomusa anaerophila]|uniref:Mg-protoporphyrin IX chelatase n=1 Tax=Methylomusa anaerophila TaxID=1930071 RepID=A0A348AEB8_9FIRM|nr:ATP-binding protein [Methylomusa anaerophila]BBB89416.1 magnesium-chelatase 38 kDa subunit [Methylomusa anaerophila]
MHNHKPMNYPFAAIVGQESMKKGLMLNVINPRLSGILIRGEKGTAKSTAVRALAELLPEIDVVADCPYHCDPDQPLMYCPQCHERVEKGEKLPRSKRPMKVVNLPVSATEDRVVGTLDIEHAIKHGEKKFEPGVLAEANRGILYVDEVNLLDDHIVDVLLDAAAMGVNTVEREGVSFSHPAQFILVGTMNPEEGELRPQLLDRFGLCVTIEGIADTAKRVDVIKRRTAFEENQEAFAAQWEEEQSKLRDKIAAAQNLLAAVSHDDDVLFNIADIAIQMGVDGHRADLVMLKAAKALAALNGRDKVERSDVSEVVELALMHRMRKKPFQEIGSEQKKLQEILGHQHAHSHDHSHQHTHTHSHAHGHK